MKDYIPKSSKSGAVQKIINEALDILASVGIPFNGKSERALVKMAVSFLAVAGVKRDWSKAKSAEDGVRRKTRDIIEIVNKNFEESISPGSYDDIRRKDLPLLVMADLVLNSGVSDGSATNDPTRGYALSPEFKKLIVTYKTAKWPAALKAFMKGKSALSDRLSRKRALQKTLVRLPLGKEIELSLGDHNVLQQSIIQEFLPRFGSDCEVLYIGDTLKKVVVIDEVKLQQLRFFDIGHGKVPDIVAYSKEKNWLYLIEAVHSSGPMSELRVFELKKMLKDCRSELIFVTCFLSRAKFKSYMLDIAWETEVWIADNPDHLIHFNGHKYLGSY